MGYFWDLLDMDFGYQKNMRSKRCAFIGFGLAWVVIMIYMPVSIQRRFIEGLWVVLIVVSFRGIEKICTNKIGRTVLGVILLVSMLPSLFIMFW
jgi:hypothetical protein